MFGEGEVRKNNKDITLGRRRVFNNSDTAELHYVLQNRKNLRGSSIKRVLHSFIVAYSIFKNTMLTLSKIQLVKTAFSNDEALNSQLVNLQFQKMQSKKQLAQKPIIYFTSKHQYFPLIQLYLNEGKREYALSALFNLRVKQQIVVIKCRRIIFKHFV